MREWIKSYHVFLSGRWMKRIVYLLFPSVFFGIGYVFGKGVLSGYFAVIILSSMIISVEVCMDYFIFGGIAARDTNKLEYLKTSEKGMLLLKKSLIGDAVRRILSISVIVYGLKYLYGYEFTNGQLLTLVLCYFVLSEAALIMTRHFTSLLIVASSAMIVSLAAPWLTAWLLSKTMNTFLAGIILVILAVGVATGSRIMIMRKARESYYDERDEKSV